MAGHIKSIVISAMSPDPFHVEAFIFVMILVVYVLTSHIIESRKIPYLHESSIAIMMGMLTAVISKYVRVLEAGPGAGNRIQQRALLRSHPPPDNFQRRVLATQIPLLLKLPHDQFSGHLRDHHRFPPALGLPHPAQLLLPSRFSFR